MSAADVLGGRPATRATRQVIALADRAGLRPHPDPSPPRHGRYRVLVDSGGRRDCLFGAIYIGARTGRILRAWLTHGSQGQERRYDTVADIRAVIRSWAALHRDTSGRA